MFPERWRREDSKGRSERGAWNEFPTDSLSTPHVGSKSKESKKSVDGSSTSHRRQHEVEDLGTQTEWSYSDKSLASVENAISIIREQKQSGEDVAGMESSEPIPSQDTVVLFTDIDEEIETKESEEDSEENKQTKSDDQVVRAESGAAGGEDKKTDDEASRPDSEEESHDDLKITTLFLDEENRFAEAPETCEFCYDVAKPIPTVEDLDTEPLETHCHALEPVRRYYPDGQKFFLLFPDGTGQVFYPSGNIAILIMYVKHVQFTYVVLEDQTYSGIRAFFTNCGYATCYHRNGLIWLNLDLHSGFYWDKRGRRQKHWSWHDFSHHVHAPPFQPICLKLNIYIRVKIVAQDQIYLSFTKQHNCIRFNVGVRLKLKETATRHLLKPAESQLGLLLRSKTIQINSLLAQMQKALRDLQSTPLNKFHALPLVLAQLRKLLTRRHRKTLVP